MDKILKIISLKEQQSDFLFWSNKTEQERLDAIELLREQYFNSNKDIERNLQKVLELLTKKASGRHRDKDDFDNLK